jgi:O-antigen/teichoic acid export membrane protein
MNLVGAFTTALIARRLSNGAFGSYSFALSFLTFTAIFIEFGFFLPIGRRIAVAPADERRELVGFSLLVFVPVGITFSLVVFFLGFGVDSWFRVDTGAALRLIALLAAVYPFRQVALILAQGCDRLHLYSVTALGGQLLFAAALLVFSGSGLTVSRALTFYIGAFAVALTAFAVYLRPVFAGVRHHVQNLWIDVKTFGFNVYVGRVLSCATYNMDVLMLGALTNARSVGYYALAGSLAAASALPVFGVATALFAKFATTDRIDRGWLVFAWTAGIACTTIAWVAGGPFIRTVFGTRYGPAAALVLPLALASNVRSVTSVYNTFLSATGCGRELRNTGIVLTVSNLVFNFGLIPPFGAKGAAWASLLALAANLGSHLFYYRRVIAKSSGYAASVALRGA